MHPPAEQRLRQCVGFSLVELLCVVSIVSILAGAGAIALNGKSASISTDSAKIFSMISEARQLAITANVRTRFIIFTGSERNPLEWHMRRYGILREQRDTLSGMTSSFEQVGSPNSLGAGVYFQQTKAYGKGVFESEDSGKLPGAPNADYAYIEFLPSGMTTGASAANVFQIGLGDSSASSPDETQNIVIGVTQKVGRVRIEKQ